MWGSIFMKDEKVSNRNENKEETTKSQTSQSNMNNNLNQTQPQMQQNQGMCPYFMTQSCPMTANQGMQYQGPDMYPMMGGEMYPMGQSMPNWWQQGGGSPYEFGNGLSQYTSPNTVSDVWSQNQGNCTQNCTQDMYVQSGIPQPTYMPNWMGDMGMPNQSMMYNMPCGMNMKPNMQYQQRPMCSGSSYGSCYSPYGLGRY